MKEGIQTVLTAPWGNTRLLCCTHLHAGCRLGDKATQKLTRHNKGLVVQALPDATIDSMSAKLLHDPEVPCTPSVRIRSNTCLGASA